MLKLKMQIKLTQLTIEITKILLLTTLLKIMIKIQYKICNQIIKKEKKGKYLNRINKCIII
jgi:hypothetical protein